MVLQHNLPAFNANRINKKNTSKLNKSLEKLSSGYSINRAGDDAAGLAVSEKMRSQIAGMTQAVKNAQDGISMIQTFEGALTETDAILQRMKTLADQMANGTYDDAVDRTAAQQEFYQLSDELDHIADTDFNGVVVLNGGVMSDGMAADKNGLIDYKTAAASPAVQTYEAVKSRSIQPYAVAPIAAGTDTVCGDFTITGENLIAGTDYTFSGGVLTILSDKNITIRNTNPAAATSNRIEVASGVSANITLAGVNIDVSATGNANAAGKAAFNIADNSAGNVTITLADGTNNTLASGYRCAGLQKNGDTSTGTLTIKGNGTLTATGGESGAGIGSGREKRASNITISGGNVNATGGYGGGFGSGAGIGGGALGGANNITISGGNVNATGGDSPVKSCGAGIGGGYGGSADGITISGGIVTARSVENGAAIGGGSSGSGNNITISGGIVTATAGDYGAGIGGGRNTSGNNITISNSIVTATGGAHAAGIGGGLGGSTSGIKITNSTVRAKGDTANGAAHIGKGNGGTGGDAPSIRDSLVFEGNYGTIYGDFVVKNDFTIDADMILEILESATLTADEGASITNNGTMINKGTFFVNGEFVNDGIYIGNPPIYPSKDDPVKDSFKVSVSDAFSNSEAKLTYTDHIVLQVGARTKDAVDFTFQYDSNAIGDLKADLNCSASGLGIDKLDIKTQESANYAIDRIDQAINKVSLVRGTFGAIQNRLEHKIDNLNVSVENLTASESQIRDTDMPTEMMNFTRNQILAQASQSMLAQANTLPQQVMSLLNQ